MPSASSPRRPPRTEGETIAKKLLALSGLATAVLAVTTYAAPVTLTAPTTTTTTPVAAAVDTHADESGPESLTRGHGTSVVDVKPGAKAQQTELPSKLEAWPVPTRRSYYITSSCAPHAAAIRQGAAAWQGLTEGGGTPVECRNSYITDCGGGGRIVGCNWGRGQRIALYMGGVNDDALLAAHEFGHDWYGHSNYQCAGWSSAAHVMAPSICN